MKKFFLALFFLLLISCGHSLYSPIVNKPLGTSVLVSEQFDFSRPQFDSICQAERLPNDLSKWLNASLRDFEDKKPIHGFMILRPDTDKNFIVFTTRLKIAETDTTFIFERRKETIKK